MNYNNLIKSAFAVLLLLFIFSLWQRVPDVDDAWIGEHAYWLSEKGYVKSELMHGITSQEDRHIVHHKLFTLNGLVFIRCFGFSLYSLKSVSLLWLAVFMFVFFKYIKNKFDSKMAWLAMLFLISNSFIFQYSFVYRPEMMVMTLGFFSFICIEKYLKDEKYKFLILGGLTAGLAASAHLNGLIYIGAGSLVLFWKKKPVPALIILLASLPGIAVYFYDFTSKYNLAYWFYQLNDSPALHKSTVVPSSLIYLMKILNEHLRFFHSPKEIILSLLLIFAVLINFKYLKNKTIYLHYLLLLIVLLSLISVHSTSKYLLLYLPIITLVIITSFNKLFSEKLEVIRFKLNSSNQKSIALVLIILFFGTHLSYDVLISSDKYNTAKNAEITNKYFSENTEQLAILAPMDFIFNELPKYGRIQSDLSITEMKKDCVISSDEFFNIIDSLKINGMILSDEYIQKYGLKTITRDQYSKKDFSLAGKQNGYTILKRISN